MSSIPTTVKLYSNVPFSSDYQHVYDYVSTSVQEAYFDGLSHTLLENVNYNKAQNTLDVPIDLDTCQGFSYCVYSWTGSRVYYAFVQHAELINSKVTRLTLETDVWNTYLFDITIHESMVLRSHVDRYSAMTSSGYYPCQDNISTFYATEASTPITTKTVGITSGHDYGIVVMVLSRNINDVDDKGLFVYMVPVDLTSTMTYLKSTSDRAFLSIGQFLNQHFLDIYGLDAESVLSITLHNCSAYTLTQSDTQFSLGGGTLTQVGSTNFDVYRHNPEYISSPSFINAITDVRPVVNTVTNALYSPTFEPALYRQPFRRRCIVDARGNIILTIPDFVAYSLSNINVKFINMMSDITQYDKLIINNSNDVNGGSTIISPPNIDLISDAWVSYAATQRDTDRQILNNQLNQSNLESVISTATSTALIGAMMGGAVGAGVGFAAGAAGTLLTGIVNNAYAWDNQDLKETQIKNNPSTLLQLGSAGASLAGRDVITYVVFKADTSIVNYYSKVYHKYGYKINRFMQPDITSRYRFNYIMTQGATVTGSVNEEVKKAIAGILDSGVTVWHYGHTTMHDYSKDNTEV